MTRSPSISVAMPVYNGERWIRETLESVVSQTSPPDEIVVVDDGSTDGTIGEVERFGDRVRLLRQENRGYAEAFNTAFENARGEYVAICPADDLWEPEKLAWQRETLAAHPEVDVSFGHARNFGLRSNEHPRPPGEGVLDNHALTRAMLVHNVVAAPSAAVRRSLWDSLGRFSSEIASEDYDLWWRALRAGAVFHYDPRVMVNLRQHGTNASADALRVGRSNYTLHAAAADLVDDPALVRKILARDLRAVGRASLGDNRVAEARSAYRDSLRQRPNAVAAAAVAALSLPGAPALFRMRNRARQRG